MVGSFLSEIPRPRASAKEMMFGGRAAGEITLSALRVLFVGVTVALLFVWLTSANTGSASASAFGDSRGDCAGPGGEGVACGKAAN